jgi:hypothetical protein
MANRISSSMSILPASPIGSGVGAVGFELDRWMESPFVPTVPGFTEEISSNVTIPIGISPISGRHITLSELISTICVRFGLSLSVKYELRLAIRGISVFNVPNIPDLDHPNVDDALPKPRSCFSCCCYQANNRLLDLTAEGEADTLLASGMVYPPKNSPEPYEEFYSDTVLDVTTDCELQVIFNVDVAFGRRLMLAE